MVDWVSDTSEMAIVSLENGGTGGSEVVDGSPTFHADLYRGMRTTAEVEKYLDAVQTYLPMANTLRMPINAKSLHPKVPGSNVVATAIRSAASRGFGIVLVYTDPIFLGSHRKPYVSAYYDNNVSVLTGQQINLDAQVASGREPKTIVSWGSQSPEHDPLDELIAGWGSVLDWVSLHPEVHRQIRGYELVNEPGRAYTASGDPLVMHAYASAMAELYQAHAPRWTEPPQDGTPDRPVSVMVGIAGGGSGRVGALDRAPPGQPDSGLELIRKAIGEPLVWSVHTFTDTSLEEFTSVESYTKLYQLAGDDNLVTETQFDGDFQLLGNAKPGAKQLATIYGAPTKPDGVPLTLQDFYDHGESVLAPWMGWELLDPMMGSRNYFGAREKFWFGRNGIGSGYWTPVGYDASMFVGYSGKNIEISRDITAFANAMWAAGAIKGGPDGSTGKCGHDESICIKADPVRIRGNLQLAPMIGIGSIDADKIKGEDTPETEGGRKYFRQGGREQSAGQTVLSDKHPSNGDMAYGLVGDDLLELRGGDDFGFGGPGRDSILGGTGHDVLLGDDGDDLINGEGGDDVIEGGAGNDTLVGGAGTDLIKGDGSDDLMTGSPGQDYFYLDAGGDGSDTILGFQWGIDRLFIGNNTDYAGTGKRQISEVNTTEPRAVFEYAGSAKVTFRDEPSR